MVEDSDEELVELFRRSSAPERDAFLNRVFERHHARVAAWCYRLTGDADLASDLAQEVFLKAFQHLHTFRGQSKFTTWLYSIARNHCMDALKARAAAHARVENGILDQLEDFRAVELIDGMERNQAEQALRQLVRDSLDETEARVLTLHYAEELPLDAVTRLLGLTNASGAKAYIVSARRKLTRALSRWNRREQRRNRGGHARS